LTPTTTWRIASISGTSSPAARNADCSARTSPSKARHSAAALESKYLKNVRRLTPAAAAICSTVVSSKPRSVNSRSAISSSWRALVPGGRPRGLGLGGAGLVCVTAAKLGWAPGYLSLRAEYTPVRSK